MKTKPHFYNLIIRLTVVLCFLFLVATSLYYSGFSMKVLISRGNQFFVFLGRMFPPEWAYIREIISPLLLTIQMSVAGTFLGGFLAIFTAFLYTEKLNKNVVIRGFVHVIVQGVRTIPVLIIALICTFVWGLGAFAGTMALLISTWAVMTRIGGEDLSKMNLNAYNAVLNSGASKFNAFARTILVQLLPGYLTNALYLFETNVRHAAILGYVGAGGIGLLLNEKISWRQYGKVGMILVMLYITVVCIELLSGFLRKYLNGEQGTFLGRKTGSRGSAGKAKLKIKKMFVYVLTFSVVVVSLLSLKFPDNSALGLNVVKSIVSGLLHPDWEFLFLSGKDGVLYLMLETFFIAFAGTILGAVFSVVLSICSSKMVVPIFVALPVKALVMAIRTIPVFVYGLMFIRVSGPGSFAGMLTLTLCSVGLITKRFTVALDNMDKKAFLAYKNMGVGLLARIRWCIYPQIRKQWLDAVIYRFDVNLRSASTLGLVGAGGIGAPLIFAMNNYHWNQVGSILITLFVVVLLLEFIGKMISKRIR